MQDSAGAPVEWIVSTGLVPYEAACAFMDARVEAIKAGKARELVWLVEHPPLYTAGTSADPTELIDIHRFPVHRSGRGGRYTYHGPGQRVGYVMLNVGARFGDVRAYVAALEMTIIDTLGALGVQGRTIPGRVGVWVPRMEGGRLAHDKIAAIGVRLRRWVSSHGFSINVSPTLEHFSGIVPCGIADAGVTSLVGLGIAVGMAEVDGALKKAFERRFGAIVTGSSASPSALPSEVAAPAQ